MVTPYRGRFAPSPSGPLHFGSLVAATTSYLQAQANNGEWWLRIEDIDPPREVAGASEAIISSLAAHGFIWTGEIQYQSRNREQHDAAIKELLDTSQAYPCTCTRKHIRATAKSGPAGPVYPGTCRNGPDSGMSAHKALASNDGTRAIRIRTSDEPVAFTDQLQGQIEQRIRSQIGDILVLRKNKLIAYHLAVVVDDHAQGITEIVRGTDLLESTPVQIFLQRMLGLATPAYMHFPIAVDSSGDKLSKQTGAKPVNDATPVSNLLRCLQFLGQQPPDELSDSTVAIIWDWARENWHPEALSGVRNLDLPGTN